MDYFMSKWDRAKKRNFLKLQGKFMLDHRKNSLTIGVVKQSIPTRDVVKSSFLKVKFLAEMV